MTLRIMLLNMRELRRLAKSRDFPIQISHPLVQSRISRANIAKVAFEVLNVDGVEADYSGEETDVGFGYGWTEVEGAGGGGEVGFGAVEGGEEGFDGGFVGFLGAGSLSGVCGRGGR